MDVAEYIKLAEYDSAGLLKLDKIKKLSEVIGGTMPGGSADQSLRHDGSVWTANDILKIESGGITVDGYMISSNAKVSNLAGTGTRNIAADDAGNLVIDDAGLGGLPSGTENQTLRHDGSDWIANSILKVKSDSVIISDDDYSGSSNDAFIDMYANASNGYNEVMRIEGAGSLYTVINALKIVNGIGTGIDVEVNGTTGGDTAIKLKAGEYLIEGYDASDNNVFNIEDDGTIFSNPLAGTGTRNVAANEDGELIIDDAGLGGGSGLEYWTENRDTDAPNATVPAHQLIVDGTETNIDAVISPKGTGAILAQVPDGTAAGGNKRGNYAIDLQRVRNNSDQVAGATYSSILGGIRNKVNNPANAGQCIVSGISNINGGNWSVIGGGTSNSLSAAYSIIGSGYYNSITGTAGSSAILGGANNIIADNYYGSILGGYYGKTSNYGQQAHAAGRFAATGDAQKTEMVWRINVNATSGDDTSEMFLDGSSERFVLPDYSTVNLVVSYTIRRIGNTNNEAGGLFAVTIKRDGGVATTALVGTATMLHWADNSSSYTPPAFSGDITNGSLKIVATTPNGYNCQHVATCFTAETFASS
jgi:hypothetical protein